MAVTGMLAENLGRHWWVLFLRGIVAILFGVLAFTRPGATLKTLVLLFGLYSFVDGFLGAWSALTNRGDTKSWAWLLLGSVFGMGVGVITLFAPRVTGVVLLIYIAIWAITSGVVEIAMAMRLRREIEGEWLVGVAGAASIALGIMLLSWPHAGAVTFAWLIAAYAIVLGAALIGLSFEVRNFAKLHAVSTS